MPSVAQHAWESFWTIERRGRSGSGFGANPISHQEILAWLALRGEKLAPWELRLMDIMEEERLAFLNRDPKEKDKNKPATKPNGKAQRTFSLDVFDALFGQRAKTEQPDLKQ